MNEKFNKNAQVEQLTKVVLSHGEEKGLIVKDPLFHMYKCQRKPKFSSKFRHMSMESKPENKIPERC